MYIEAPRSGRVHDDCGGWGGRVSEYGFDSV